MSDNSGPILDVGSGELPVSSILFGKSHDDVKSMDKSFLFSKQCLENYNVDSILQFFTNKTDITDYGFVTGNRPCSAIESIVLKCSSENKPFFLQTCDCEIPRMYNDWSDYFASFRELDGKVKFYEDFVYNVDISEDTLEKIIDKNSISFIRYDKANKRPRYYLTQIRDISKKYQTDKIAPPTGKVVFETENELE